MSFEVLEQQPPAPNTERKRRLGRRSAPHTSLTAHGESIVWLSGGGLAIALVMVVSLLAVIFVKGFGTFWPAPLVRVELYDGKVFLGEPTRTETYRPTKEVLKEYRAEVGRQVQAALEAGREAPGVLAMLEAADCEAYFDRVAADPAQLDEVIREASDKLYDEGVARLDSAGGVATRRSLRTGNFELTDTHFHWIDDFAVAREELPPWALVVERQEKGRFYGTPEAMLIDGEAVATDPAEIWSEFQKHHPRVRERFRQRVSLDRHDVGAISREQDDSKWAIAQAELSYGVKSDEAAAARAIHQELSDAAHEKLEDIRKKTSAIDEENDRYQISMRIADDRVATLRLAGIVRAYPANQLSFGDKLGVYFSRWGEFLLDDPRNVNTEGGIFPAIWGTVAMTLTMSVLVVPFGVLAALYLREYARSGPLVSGVRIAINNLAGVPSIVFGVFGLGFFCYIIGGGIDELFFQAKKVSGTPTFGTGGLLWASLTLALLTLPVVIVSTEEALAAVPNSMREGSYACGASKWQTIRRIVLPRALPGIMTGTILAMARGAGEVAPLMLVGVVKLAPELPVDGVFPFVHAQRSFMHLGFHIYDVGFKSPNSEATQPLVFTTTMLLITIIAVLNIAAVWLRNRLRRKFVSAAF